MIIFSFSNFRIFLILLISIGHVLGDGADTAVINDSSEGTKDVQLVLQDSSSSDSSELIRDEEKLAHLLQEDLGLAEKLARIPSEWSEEKIESLLGIRVQDICPKVSLHDSIICATYLDRKTREECYPKVFSPLYNHSFMEVFWGQVLPSGLDVQIDMETGVKRAKFPSANDTQSAKDKSRESLEKLLANELDFALSETVKAWSSHDEQALLSKLRNVEDLVHATRHGQRITRNFPIVSDISREYIGEDNISEEFEVEISSVIDKDKIEIATRSLDLVYDVLLNHSSPAVRRQTYLILAYSLTNNNQAFENLYSSRFLAPFYTLLQALVHDKPNQAEVIFALASYLRESLINHKIVVSLVFIPFPSWFIEQSESLDEKYMTPMELILGFLESDAYKHTSNKTKLRCQRRVIELFVDVFQYFIENHTPKEGDLKKNTQESNLACAIQSRGLNALSTWCRNLREISTNNKADSEKAIEMTAKFIEKMSLHLNSGNQCYSMF